MKKLLYSIATLAVLCFAAGCQREVDIDPVKGELVETEFVVTLDDATVTKAAINNDAANIDKLIIAAFKKSDGTYLPDLNETNGNFVISSVENNNAGQKQFSVQAKLVRNFQYTIAFFALHDGAPYTLGTDGSITMAAGATNDETLDAFYNVADITLDPSDATTLSTTVTLTRPLAQINILSDPADWAAAKSSGITTGLQSSISIAKAPNKLALYDGAISGETTLAFTQTAVPAGDDDIINVGTNETAKNAHYVAMAYVLSSDSASPVDVTFAVPANGTDFTGFTRTVENVPNRRNYRTNLHGDLFTTSGNFTVVIDPSFGGNDNQDINIPQPTVSPLGSIPTGISNANPGIQKPTIDPSNNNVTTNLADGKLFFGIDTNSDGAITYSSSDHNVGTIDNDGVFTPVGPGTTNITVTQAAGTQTKAIGDPLAEITIVYHVTVEATEYTVTVSGTPANGTVEIKNEAGDAEFTQGISGTKFTVVATPATNYNLGSLVVADTDGNLEASEGKYTIRTSNVTVTATFVAMGQVATPVISPDGGYYTAGEKATITCSEDGAAIYYTLDGTEPSATSTLYEGPIDLTNCTIKAIAIKSGMINSAVAEATFTAKLATEIVLADQNMTFGGEALTLTPVVKAGETTVSGAEFTYTAGNAKVSVTSAGVVTALAAGESSVNINATVPEAYLAPEAKTVAISIAKAASSISWNSGDLSVTVGGSALDLSDKYTKTGSTGAVSFAIASGADKAHLDGNTLVADAEGSVTINATVVADENYDGATTTTAKTVTVNAAAVTKYDVIVDDATVNGTVSADKAEAAAGETVTLTITPAEYYELDVLTVEDENSQAVTVNNNQFAMPEGGVTVTATFKKLKYAVNISTMTNGTVTVDETPAEWGAAVLLTVTPESGYQLVENSLTVTSGVTDLTDMTGGEWGFTMPKNAVTVSAEFEATTPVYQYVGSGTADDPYTVADVRHFIDGLNGATSENVVYVTGIVTADSYAFAANKTGSFYIGDTQDATDTFEAYKVAYVNKVAFADGHKKIAVGDNVVVGGKVKYYESNSVYETTGDSDSYIYSLNGETSLPAAPTISTPSNATEIAAADGSYLTVTLAAASGLSIYYTIDGSVPTSESTEYTAPFNISAACTVKAIAAKIVSEKVIVTSSLNSQDYTKAGQAQATAVYTANFEGESEHRTSGNNSYSSNTYTVTGVTWTLSKADCVTTGSPLSGSAHIICRIKGSSNNGSVVTDDVLKGVSKTLTKLSYESQLATNVTVTVSCSTDNSTWTQVDTYSGTTRASREANISAIGATDHLYLKFEYVTSDSSSTTTNRDSKLDDVVVYGN
jgi:hypothetical protein